MLRAFGHPVATCCDMLDMLRCCYRLAGALSLNVRGLNKTIKRRQIFVWLHQQNPDVVFLQETYSSAQNLKSWESEWGGKMIGSHGTNHSRGVMILFRSKLEVNL